MAAVDLGPQTPRILYHAAAFALLLDVKLKVVHVSRDLSDAAHERLRNTCLQKGPYQVDFDRGDVVLRAGRVSEVIAREALRERAALVVVGARGHSSVTTFLLGSTSDALLRAAVTPILLVPPTDIDIVSLGDTAALTCGPVIAAVDLSEHCDEQLRMASLLAQIASQPLILMTVAKSRTTDHRAKLELRQRSQALEPKRPTAIIVRRGQVADEISRCAASEGAGLVVMGLRNHARCQPGSIATAVMKTGKAFVLAVPGC